MEPEGENLKKKKISSQGRGSGGLVSENPRGARG